MEQIIKSGVSSRLTDCFGFKAINEGSYLKSIHRLLCPKEIGVAVMVREGRTSMEIAE